MGSVVSIDQVPRRTRKTMFTVDSWAENIGQGEAKELGPEDGVTPGKTSASSVMAVIKSRNLPLKAVKRGNSIWIFNTIGQNGEEEDETEEEEEEEDES